MLLTITTTSHPATDLGFLLHKNPARVQEFTLSFGRATVFYPEASDTRCTVCLLLEVDPIGLVRRPSGPAGAGRVFDQYVNDRPYVASSLLSVAISEVFGSALAGRSKDRPDLVARRLPFEVQIPVLPSRAGEPLIRELFEPLGYGVVVERLPLDPQFPEWGPSRYFHVTTHYWEAGPVDGPLMMFLHGWPQIGLMWRAQVEAFASEGWHCIAPDMRGYGGSSAPTTSEAYALKEIVEDMVELHDHLGARPAIWIGVSRHQLTHADKGANNDDTHVNGAITAKHRRKHSDTLLGKHERGPAQSHL